MHEFEFLGFSELSQSSSGDELVMFSSVGAGREDVRQKANEWQEQVFGMAYQFECAAPDCVFLIRAANEDEVISQVQRHSEEHHDKSRPPADVIRDRMKTVEVE